MYWLIRNTDFGWQRSRIWLQNEAFKWNTFCCTPPCLQPRLQKKFIGDHLNKFIQYEPRVPKCRSWAVRKKIVSILNVQPATMPTFRNILRTLSIITIQRLFYLSQHNSSISSSFFYHFSTLYLILYHLLHLPFLYLHPCIRWPWFHSVLHHRFLCHLNDISQLYYTFGETEDVPAACVYGTRCTI